MDDSSPRRRGDVALCCAYVLQGNDWAPVNNSRPDDLTNESRFLAAKIVQDDDMAEAFLELHDYPQTTIGVLLVETCQGKTPFRASTPRQLMLNIIREAPQIIGDDEKFRSAVEKLLHKRASRRLRSAAQLAKRRFFEPLDFAKLERKELAPPFTPKAGRVPNVPDQNLVKKFGPHRLSDGDSPSKEGGNSDEVSLSFKGEQFQGFSVFASPAPPVRRKSSKDLK